MYHTFSFKDISPISSATTSLSVKKRLSFINMTPSDRSLFMGGGRGDKMGGGRGDKMGGHCC